MQERKRRIKLKPGDVIEIPLGKGWFAYSRILQDIGYQPYAIIAKERPEIGAILASGFLDRLYVCEYRSEVAEWPRVGKHPFNKGEDEWPPPGLYGPDRVYDHGAIRNRTDHDRGLEKHFTYDEQEFVAYLRERLLAPLGIRCDDCATDTTALSASKLSPMEAAMSVDRNDVAEQVKIQFDDFIDDGLPAEKAMRMTMHFFRDEEDDYDRAPSYWLGLAAVAIKSKCLTREIRDRALKILSSEECWNVAENWPVKCEADRQEVRQLRRQALDQLQEQLMNYSSI